jgi:hypothetical protein
MWEYLDELIAVILVVGCLILIVFRIDTEVKSILTIAAGWAFGKTYGRARANRRHKDENS